MMAAQDLNTQTEIFGREHLIHICDHQGIWVICLLGTEIIWPAPSKLFHSSFYQRNSAEETRVCLVWLIFMKRDRAFF